MERPQGSEPLTTADPSAGERYLLLADISGYTGFMSGVEQEHGVDFSAGIPAAYGILADLLNSVLEGVQPDFALVKLEGDAVFAAAPPAPLDGHGEAIPANDHVCTACPAVAHLDLKAVLHRGQSVRQMVGSGSDLLGPAVTVAHRLLKNTVREQIGARPYLLMTDAAAGPLGLSAVGLTHHEEY